MSRALENERAKLEKIFEKAPTFLVVFQGPEYIFERVNEAYLQLSHKTNLLGKRLLDAIPEMKEQEWFAELEQVFTTGKPYFGKEVKVNFKQDDSKSKEVYLNLGLPA